MPTPVCVCMCVFLKERKRQRGGGRAGGRLMWFSLGPPEAWSLEKSRLIGEERDRRGGVLFILTCSTQSLALASQLRCCGSSAMYTKQCNKLHEHTGDGHSQK